MELDIFRSDVVNLAFRYRQLRKYVRRDLLRFRGQLAFANHCQNLGRLAMKVPGVMVTMIVLMPVLMVMYVIVAVRFAMRLMGGVVFVFLLTINQYIKFDGTDVGARDARHPQFVTVYRQLSQFGLEEIKTKAGVQERTDRHVAADARKAIEVERLHTFLMLTLPFMLLDLHTRLKDALRSTIRTQWNIDPPDIVLNQTPKIEFGELATPVAFELARQLKKAPRAISEELIARTGKIDGVDRMEAAGAGYINFFLDRASSLRGSRLRGFPADEGKVIVEHTNINPNKAAHIGHLRNAAIGDTFVRVLQASGRTVEVQNYIDNTGVQVADVVVGLKHVERKSLEDVPADDRRQVGPVRLLLLGRLCPRHSVLRNGGSKTCSARTGAEGNRRR